MYNNNMTIDISKLRKDMLNGSYGAFFGGGFGGAMMQSFDIENASPQQLVQMAQKQGIDLRHYAK